MKRYWIVTVAVLGVVAICAVFIGWNKRSTTAEPDLSNLAVSLAKQADTYISPPSLADMQISLFVRRVDLETEISRVQALALRLGGSAVPDGEGQPSQLLASIPAEFAPRFIEAVKDPAKTPPASLIPVKNEMRLVEVKFEVTSS
jgi:hypothetical protein